MMAEYEPVSKNSTKLGGIAATEMVYRGAVGTPPRKLQFKAVFAIKDQTAYVFTYTAPTAAFDKHVKTFDLVMKSVKWQRHKH